jgi:hypothetical protein
MTYGVLPRYITERYRDQDCYNDHSIRMIIDEMMIDMMHVSNDDTVIYSTNGNDINEVTRGYFRIVNVNGGTTSAASLRHRFCSFFISIFISL